MGCGKQIKNMRLPTACFRLSRHLGRHPKLCDNRVRSRFPVQEQTGGNEGEARREKERNVGGGHEEVGRRIERRKGVNIFVIRVP